MLILWEFFGDEEKNLLDPFHVGPENLWDFFRFYRLIWIFLIELILFKISLTDAVSSWMILWVKKYSQRRHSGGSFNWSSLTFSCFTINANDVCAFTPP